MVHISGNKCRPDFHREASNVKSKSLDTINHRGQACFGCGLDDTIYFLCTLIFQTVRHFTSVSRLKCSQNDFYTDINWIFKLNQVNISNRKPTNTLTNHVQCVFLNDFAKHFDNHIAPKNTQAIYIVSKTSFVTLHFHIEFFSALFEACVLFTTKQSSTKICYFGNDSKYCIRVLSQNDLSPCATNSRK